MGNITHAAAATSGSSFIFIIVVIFGVIYFVAMRPGRKRQQRAQQQQNAVEPGARVRTTAGMYATVVATDGDDVILEVAPDVEVRYMKRAIMEVISAGPVDETADYETDEDGTGEDDESADHDEHLENEVHEVHEEHEEAAVPAGNYGEDLTINGRPDKAKANGGHSETATPGSTAATKE